MTDVFTEEQKTPDASSIGATPATKTSTPEGLDEWVGEGKKYKTVDDALKSVPHAQKHISAMEEKMKAMEEELAKRKAAEELLAEIRATTTQKQDTTSTLDESAVAEIAARTMAQRELEKTYAANAESVRNKLTELFGDKAKEKFVSKADELGLDVASLNAMARKSPKAVLAYFQTAGGQSIARTSSGVNTAAMDQGRGDSAKKVSAFSGSTSDLVQAWRNAKPTT